MRNLSCCRIKGIFKYTMTKFYAQVEERKELDKTNVPYRDWNLILMKERDNRRAKKAMTLAA